jgi:hypothetical protein
MVCGVAFAGVVGGVEVLAEPETSDFASLTAFLTSSQPENTTIRQDINVGNRLLKRRLSAPEPGTCAIKTPARLGENKASNMLCQQQTRCQLSTSDTSQKSFHRLLTSGIKGKRPIEIAR